MKYKEALNVQAGDLLHLKRHNFRETRVLRIEHDRRYHVVTFHCTNGDYVHKEVSLPISNDELVKKFIEDPMTRVYISHNKELGEWLYSVVVEDTDEFWLASFGTHEEAEQYIAEHQLKKAKKVT